MQTTKLYRAIALKLQKENPRLQGARAQYSFHGSGTYSIQFFHCGRLLADIDISQSFREAEIAASRAANPAYHDLLDRCEAESREPTLKELAKVTHA